MRWNTHQLQDTLARSEAQRPLTPVLFKRRIGKGERGRGEGRREKKKVISMDRRVAYREICLWVICFDKLPFGLDHMRLKLDQVKGFLNLNGAVLGIDNRK